LQLLCARETKLHPAEPAIRGLWQIFREELRCAKARLVDETSDPDEAIHEARRSLKKVRSILKLLRPGLGDRYARENSRLGDIGGRLSPFRDGAALLETFDDLHRNYADRARPEVFRAVRAGLAGLKRELEEAENLSELRRQAARDLTPGRPWPLGSNDLAAVMPGLEESWSKAKKALARVRKEACPENFHALRKRVKTHRYQLMVLADAVPAHGCEKTLRKLDQWLGDAHNLAVMAERIAKDPLHFGAEEHVHAMLRLIGKRQNRLQEKSLARAEKLYGSKPKSFISSASRGRERPERA
jgi:CHAD domain-containing protein